MRRAGIAVTALGIALALGAVWCRRGDGSVQAPSTGTVGAVEEPTAAASSTAARPSPEPSPRASSALSPPTSASSGAAAPSAAPDDAGLSHSPLSAPSPSSSARVIGAVVAQRDPRDLAFLAHLERELKRDPPPEARRLIELRRAGASRDELVAYVREQFPPDLQLRALALRWIDDDGSDAGGPKPGVPASAGSGPPLVKPIAPR